MIYAEANNNNNDESTHTPGQTYKVINNGKLLTQSSRQPFKGDEIYLPDGSHYRVVRCRGKIAEAVFLGPDKRLLKLIKYYGSVQTVSAIGQNWADRPVAIYHTHTDESYLPSDGKASIPFKGGIYQVGEAFNARLQKIDVNTLFDKTPHDPHDSNAYYRSRRTVFQLLKEKPVAMFDIHRDGVDDPEFYRKRINGEPVTQLRIVVGRQNPKMSANLEFAQRLMAYANEKYPGLVMEIYKARGNYNQDLYSTALLIEAGTYTNEKEKAEQGIAMLANIVPGVLGLNAPEDGTQLQPIEGRAQWKTAVFLIMLVSVAGAFFVAINAGPKELEEFTKKMTAKIPVEKIQAILLSGAKKADTYLVKIKDLLWRIYSLVIEKIIPWLVNVSKIIKEYLQKKRIR